MDIIKRLKEMLEGKNRKKLVENAVVIIIVGIIVIIAAGTFLSGNKNNTNTGGSTPAQEAAQAAAAQPRTEDSVEDELAAILSKVQGVGRVDVMITYVSGKENIPAYNTKKSESTTDEKDSGGGTRSITQGEYDSSVVFEDRQGGGKSPVILKELQPVVKGVVVVADGAGSPEVRERILKAVQVLVDVPVHKIQVIQMRK